MKAFQDEYDKVYVRNYKSNNSYHNIKNLNWWVSGREVESVWSYQTSEKVLTKINTTYIKIPTMTSEQEPGTCLSLQTIMTKTISEETGIVKPKVLWAWLRASCHSRKAVICEGRHYGYGIKSQHHRAS